METRGAEDIWLIKVGEAPSPRCSPVELSSLLWERRPFVDRPLFVWLLQFYTPWCTFCKQLDPVWHQIGSELKSRGSSINVGKCDASVSTGEWTNHKDAPTNPPHCFFGLCSFGQRVPCQRLSRHPHVSPALGNGVCFRGNVA